MKRTGFAPKTPRREPTQCTYTPRPRTPAAARDDGKARMVVPLPKAELVRSEAYRRLVAAMPCALCHKPGPSQAAHADFGKGLSLKADDRTCFPLCADAPGRNGCHTSVGSMGLMGKQERREFEIAAAYATATAIYVSGQWPKWVPVPWAVSEEQTNPSGYAVARTQATA